MVLPDKNTGNKISEAGAEVIRHQAKVLSSLADKIGVKFEDAVNAILSLSSKGRLIVTGVGKAECIAQKISSTFASVGIHSFLVDLADSMHGDLGRFCTDDIIIILSNSGETSEILQILPELKKIKPSIIAITRDSNSTLARHSSICIELGQIEECWPIHIAPTASSTAMLALGDALAMVCAHQRGFTKENYGQLHPGGDIGRSLKLVSEVMRSGERNCIVSENTTVRETIHKYTSTIGRPGAATIIGNDGLLTGIFTDGNLRRLIDNNQDFLDRPVKTVMSKNPKTILYTELAKDALSVLAEFQIDQIIVVNTIQKPVGMIDIQDLLSVFSPFNYNS